MYKKKICTRCKKEYTPKSPKQKYCGNQKTKRTCSYIVYIENAIKKDFLLRTDPKTRESFLKRKRDSEKKRMRNPEYREKKRKYKESNPLLEIQRIKYKKRRLKLRFEIFERDNFTCQYCGRKAPNVVLNIDHIYPKSKGGLNKKNNYRTSCSECNIGKRDSILNEFK